ncbi:hypothetical protein BC628DRAFT_1005156 [Trametes gibbosa]|nr:hypothetical protein BC628DRAFT_1005156 [Trametes gibbosa]
MTMPRLTRSLRSRCCAKNTGSCGILKLRAISRLGSSGKKRSSWTSAKYGALAFDDMAVCVARYDVRLCYRTRVQVRCASGHCIAVALPCLAKTNIRPRHRTRGLCPEYARAQDVLNPALDTALTMRQHAALTRVEWTRVSLVGPVEPSVVVSDTRTR